MSVNEQSADESFMLGSEPPIDSPDLSLTPEPPLHSFSEDTEFTCGPEPIITFSPMSKRSCSISHDLSNSSPLSPNSFASLSPPPFDSLVAWHSWVSASPMSPPSGSLFQPQIGSPSTTMHAFTPLATPPLDSPCRSQSRDLVPPLRSPWHSPDRTNTSCSNAVRPKPIARPTFIDLTESSLCASATPPASKDNTGSPKMPNDDGKFCYMPPMNPFLTFAYCQMSCMNY